MKIDDYLTTVADNLCRYGCFVKNNGLLRGKAGIALLLFRYSRYANDHRIEMYAIEVLNDLIEDMSQGVSERFDSDICGIGIAMTYLLNNGYVVDGLDDALSEIDQYIVDNGARDTTNLYWVHSEALYWRARGCSGRLENILEVMSGCIESDIDEYYRQDISSISFMNYIISYLTTYALLDKTKYENLKHDDKVAKFLDDFHATSIINDDLWHKRHIYKTYLAPNFNIQDSEIITFDDVLALSTNRLKYGTNMPEQPFIDKIERIMNDENVVCQLIELVNLQSMGLEYKYSGLAWAIMEYIDIKGFNGNV